MRNALSAAGRPDVPTLEEQALYHNLCILGIVSAGLKQEGIELGRTTFRRSNNKALEYVLYRLYSIIEGKSRAQKDFKGMLPVLDKVQQAPFYQRIGDWLMELKKSGRIDPSVILPVSALKTNTSNRLVLLLLELSTVALQQDLETTCPGACRAAFLPTTASFAAGGMGGLLDDALVPAEKWLVNSTTRAKQICSEFLDCAASASSVCDAMEQHFTEYKKKYYEMQAALRQQGAALVELPGGTLAPHASGSSPHSSALGSPTSCSGLARMGSGVLLGPAAAAAAVAGVCNVASSDPSVAASGAFSGPAGTVQQQQARRSPGRGRPDPESLTALSLLLAGLEDHLRVHRELEGALMTNSPGTADGAGTVDGGEASRAPGGFADPRLRYGQTPPQQVLHPYQIDGQALAAEAQAAAAQDASARGGGVVAGFDAQQQALQRRQAKPLRMVYGPDNIVEAFRLFASHLGSLVPQVTQLAMVGENAGPPPLLQPPSQPSSHAAHVAHQLQVHSNTSRQIGMLNRQVQEKAAVIGPVLRRLRLESSRVTSSHDPSGHPDLFHDFLDDDLLDVGPHLALPPALPQPVRQVSPPFASPKSTNLGHGGPAPAAAAASSGAPSVVVMGSPCPSSAGAYMAATGGVCTSGASASAAAAPTGCAIATSTTAAPAEISALAGFGDDEYAKLQARLKNLKLHGQPVHAPAAPVAVPMAAPTSARAADAVAATLGMFSPGATLNGIGGSPMLVSAPGASARQQLLSATFNYASTAAAIQQAAGSTSALSPLRMPPLQQQKDGWVGPDAARLRQIKVPERSQNLLAVADVSSSAPWTTNPSWLGVARGDAPAFPAEMEPALPQTWPSVLGRQTYDTTAVPAWAPVLPQDASDPSPTSRLALDAQLRHAHHQPRPQYHQGAFTTTSVNASAAGLFGESFQGAPAGRSGGGCEAAATATTSTAAAQQQQQWSGVADVRKQVAASGAMDPARTTGPSTGGGSQPWDDFRGTSAAASLTGAALHAPAAQQQAAGSSVHLRGNNRRVDLRGLLDDDDDLDKDEGRFSGPSHGSVRLAAGCPAGAAAPDCFTIDPFSMAAPVSGVAASMAHSSDGGGVYGTLHADTDADFSLLAAEGEMVSQALMSGSLTALHSPRVTAPAPGAGSAAGLFAIGTGEGSGSSGAADVGGSNRTNATSAVDVLGAQRSPLDLVDMDNGDDVVMADNDKEASPVFSGAKGAYTSWLGAGPVAGQSLRQAKAPLFDAFGALVSPQQQRDNGAGGLQPESAPEATIPAAAGHLGADILALKERMRAISMQLTA